MDTAIASRTRAIPPPRSTSSRPSQRVRLHPQQTAFLQSEARYNAFIGGIGSGKSYAGAWRRLVRARKGGLYLIAAPTYPMLRDATLRTFLTVAGDQVKDFNKAEMTISLWSGAEFLCRSTDAPDRLRGPNLAGAWLDEAALMDPAVWPVLIGRLRQDGQAGEVDVTTTPRGYNWLYDTFGPDAPLVQQGAARVFYTRTADNPFLPAEFVQDVTAQYAGNFARQELDGAFVPLDGGLFKREWFRYEDHTPGDVVQWVRFWDLAFSAKQTADATVGAKVGRRADGSLVIADLVVGRWEWPQARAVIVATAQADGPSVKMGVEAVASQVAGVQELWREPALLKHHIQAAHPDKDKYTRAMPWAARAEAGLVSLVRAPWNLPFLAELSDFPQGQHDDQVDAVSGAMDLLSGRREIRAA